MSKFDEAVQRSLNAGQDYLQSLKEVENLIRELDEAVQRATSGAVSVAQQRAGNDLERDRSDAEFHRGSTLGLDPEDHTQTWVVMARGNGDERALWEITYSADGYPVTVAAPDGSEITCVTREDLEDTFLELIQQGSTGRKIKMLQEGSTKQAS